MRQIVRSAGLLSLFLLNLTTNISAEPLVRGFFIEKLPEKTAGKELAPGKGLVLAHIFNAGNSAINSGSYQVGVEIENSGKKRTFVLKPNESIGAGGLKTFRMAVPVSTVEKSTGQFRVFSKIDGNFIWSEKYSFLQGVLSDGDKKVTTLYTEAPPEPSSFKPPREVPFENEKTARKAAELEKAALAMTSGKNNATRSGNAKTVAAAKTDDKTKVAGQANKVAATAGKTLAPVTKVAEVKPPRQHSTAQKEVKTTVAPVAEEAPVQKARNIDPSEFKKLRTIDEELIIYVIKEGDSLKSVAEKYYGSAAKERTIADLNFIEKASSIKVGEEIIVDVKPLGKSGKSNS